MKLSLIAALVCLLGIPLTDTDHIFDTACDSLTLRVQRHFGVKSEIRVKLIKPEGDSYGVYLDKHFADFPWHSDDYIWFMKEFDAEWSNAFPSRRHGKLYCNGIRIEELLTPPYGSDGKPASYRLKDSPSQVRPLVSNDEAIIYTEGLYGRHIALWQSHGCYYNVNDSRWVWQRAPLHRTIEDMFTQSFVLDFLIPMLENAGACVMTPRERDTQEMEYICDNDRMFEGERSGTLRRAGTYSEKGSWSSAGTGFADLKKIYEIEDNPFNAGTARKTACSPNGKNYALWSADIPKRGRYSVYVSYKSLPESTDEAHYTVWHLGGKSHFTVNQRMGGGTWVHLGSFEFEGEAKIELSNIGNEGTFVTADAVKIGGGMGKIQRGGELSGKPSYLEGASYWIPWGGGDSSLREKEGDYKNDIAVRGGWVKMMKGKKGIPIDCSLAIHSDAGTSPKDSTIGTLAIYSLQDDKDRKFSDGSDRMSCRMFADMIQSQTVDDIRKCFNPIWQRRGLWDRKYNEVCSSDVPAMLLEILSHQNFEDMKYGHDPSFRFTVSRAIYKGILKFLSTMYGTEYTVQPLPVSNLAVTFTPEGNAQLSWTPVSDPLEKTAEAEEYIILSRIDDGAFDKGVRTTGTSFEFALSKGHIYSYKVIAVNKGGRSFPSETVSIGAPVSSKGQKVLVVNNFDRLSAPSWIDNPHYSGFTAGYDSGVPYIRDITYSGENYEFRRCADWVSDTNPGFGASSTENAGFKPAGNSFDYPYVHGKSLLSLGRAFCSMSRRAFEDYSISSNEIKVLDLICGKQVTSPTAADSSRYEVFPASLTEALTRWTGNGGSIFISGADIATDVWSNLYLEKSQNCKLETQDFVKRTLGYCLSSTFGTSKGRIGKYEFHSTLNEECYCVEAPDGLNPADRNGSVWISYETSGIPAGVIYRGKGYKVVSMGVPLECIKGEEDRTALLREALSNL